MTIRAPRPRFAMYWGAGCGGCEVAVLNLGDRFLELERACEIVFAPAFADFKLESLAARADASIDVCLFTGAIRTAADAEMAHLLRRTSRLLVAFGSCAEEGCVPALANLSTVDDLLRTQLGAPVASCGPSGELPLTSPEPIRGSDASTLPAAPTGREVQAKSLHHDKPDLHHEGPCPSPLLDCVRTLDQVEWVDYTIPGCPPEPAQVWSALEPLIAALREGAPLPPPGTVLGASRTALCEECPLPRNESKVERFFRLHEKAPTLDACLLEQGLICLGVATRGGCGALCPRVGVGCRGCYGAPEGVEDQGARVVSALAAVLDVGSPHDGDETLRLRLADVIAAVVDPLGTFYRCGLPRSLLSRARQSRDAAICHEFADEPSDH